MCVCVCVQVVIHNCTIFICLGYAIFSSIVISPKQKQKQYKCMACLCVCVFKGIKMSIAYI